MLSSASIEQALERSAREAAKNGQGFTFHTRGDVVEAANTAARHFEQLYRAPYLAHATMEPINCTARVSGGKVEVVHTELTGFGQYRVVDIGDVADAAGLVPKVAQPPLQDVVGDVGGGMPEVGGVIGRDAAGVHRDHRPRREGHDLAAGGVVQPHGDYRPPRVGGRLGSRRPRRGG